MKKVFIVVIALSSLTLTSCEKNHHCTCTYTDLYNKTYTDDITISLSKSEARKACDEQDTLLRGGNTNVSCKFK